MKYKKLILLLSILFILFAITAVSAVNEPVKIQSSNSNNIVSENNNIAIDQRTFTVKGIAVPYQYDVHHDKISKTAKKQIKNFKKINKKGKLYKITLSENDYNKLLTAKKNGKFASLTIFTGKYIKTKKPIIKSVKKKIYDKTFYYGDAYSNKFYIPYEKFYEKSQGDLSLKLKVTSKKVWINDGEYYIKYRHLTVYKTYDIITKYKNAKSKLNAYITVNNLKGGQAKYTNQIDFHASSMGISGTVAMGKLKI